MTAYDTDLFIYVFVSMFVFFLFLISLKIMSHRLEKRIAKLEQPPLPEISETTLPVWTMLLSATKENKRHSVLWAYRAETLFDAQIAAANDAVKRFPIQKLFTDRQAREMRVSRDFIECIAEDYGMIYPNQKTTK